MEERKKIMSKVVRMEAIKQVVKAMEMGDKEKADKMFRVISDRFSKDKKNNTVSEYIELQNKKEEQLFRDILIDD